MAALRSTMQGLIVLARKRKHNGWCRFNGRKMLRLNDIPQNWKFEVTILSNTYPAFFHYEGGKTMIDTTLLKKLQ